MYKRAIIITENEKLLFRDDIKVNGIDNLEKDLFNFIIKLENEKGVVNSKKIMNMLKIYHGLTISDITTVFTDNKNWRINDNHPINNDKFDNAITEE
jgi:hypothetical protein